MGRGGVEGVAVEGRRNRIIIADGHRRARSNTSSSAASWNGRSRKHTRNWLPRGRKGCLPARLYPVGCRRSRREWGNDIRLMYGSFRREKRGPTGLCYKDMILLRRMICIANSGVMGVLYIIYRKNPTEEPGVFFKTTDNLHEKKCITATTLGFPRYTSQDSARHNYGGLISQSRYKSQHAFHIIRLGHSLIETLADMNPDTVNHITSPSKNLLDNAYDATELALLPLEMQPSATQHPGIRVDGSFSHIYPTFSFPGTRRT